LESRIVEAEERGSQARAFHNFSLSNQFRPVYCVTERRMGWNAVIVGNTDNYGTTAPTCDNDNSNDDDDDGDADDDGDNKACSNSPGRLGA
jgi:hypothetical protein